MVAEKELKLSELAEEIRACPQCSRQSCWTKDRKSGFVGNGCEVHGPFKIFMTIQAAKEMMLIPPGAQIVDDIRNPIKPKAVEPIAQHETVEVKQDKRRKRAE